jgi:hypothetical protein
VISRFGVACVVGWLLITAVLAASASAAAWPPRGFYYWSSNVAYKWDNRTACKDYAEYGCWQAVFYLRRGCRDGFYVRLNELHNGAVVGDALASIEYAPARTPIRLEFDADTGTPMRGRIVKVDCFNFS